MTTERDGEEGGEGGKMVNVGGGGEGERAGGGKMVNVWGGGAGGSHRDGN